MDPNKRALCLNQLRDQLAENNNVLKQVAEGATPAPIAMETMILSNQIIIMGSLLTIIEGDQ